MGGARVAWWVFGIAAVVQLLSQLLAYPLAVAISQSFLAPALVAVIVFSRLPSSWLRNWTIAGLGFAFVGDMLPKVIPLDYEIYGMLFGFTLAQICWVIGLWACRSNSLIFGRRWQLPIYLIVAMAILAVCLPAAQGYTVVVIAYGVLLLAMAVLASGLGRIGQWGGIAFLVSDALIGFDRFAPWLDVPLPGPMIMATYIAAIGLLTLAVVRHLRSRTPPALSPPS